MGFAFIALQFVLSQFVLSTLRPRFRRYRTTVVVLIAKTAESKLLAWPIGHQSDSL